MKKDSRNVFFIETSKSNELNVRQACAVESAALQNGNLNIFTLMTGIPNNNSPSMKALSSYSNIHFRHIELGDYFLHTPLEQWYFCTTWNYGSYAIAHLSDALRLLTLYKYGGYYFDLDFVMLKSVEKYQNFLAPESRSFIASAAIHLEPDHPLIERALEEFLTTYKYVNQVQKGKAQFKNILNFFF
jgi:lactosylceramide 4-alpha-galactosyltransferase